MLPKTNPNNFTWQLWKGGCLLDLGVKTRFADMIKNRDILQKYAIGWCNGGEIPCRPKPDCIAVMFQKDEMQFWTHLMINEFENIF